MNRNRRSIFWVGVAVLGMGPGLFAADQPKPAVKTDVERLMPDGPTLRVEDAERLLEPDRSKKLFGLKLNGVVFEALKTDKPIEYISPTAPARYGYGETYLVRDPVTRRPVGLRLFGLKF